MPRRRLSAKSASPNLLERLSPQEAVAVLRQLLERHLELRAEAERLASECMTSDSVEDIAQDVYDRMTAIDLDELNGRAGKHSWGYVEPGEAATELMDESLQDFVDDMRRKAELGLVPAAQNVCVGIVQGLYRARDTNSDGALGWAPDFPAEHADYIVRQFLRGCSQTTRKEACKSVAEILAKCAPDWAESLLNFAKQTSGQ